MELETSTFHLLTQHPIALFIVGAVLLLALMFVIVFLVSGGRERKEKKD